jgi:hypothetical protein
MPTRFFSFGFFCSGNEPVRKNTADSPVIS